MLIQKLKIILQSKLFLIIYILIVTLIVLLFIKKPTNSKYSNNTNKIGGYITNITIKDSYVQLEINAREKILALDYNIEDIKYQIGDYVEIVGLISTNNKYRNKNLFDYRKYLLGENILVSFYVKNINVIKKNKNIFYQLKNNIYNYIKKYKSSAYLYVFILGDSSHISKNVKDSYKNNGVSHLFAVSGMHVSLLSLIIAIIFKKIKKDYIIFSITVTFLSLYVFLTNFSPSIVRALLMFITFFINKKTLNLSKPYLYIYLTGLVLLINPRYVYNKSFVFSYAITFTLVTFANSIKTSNYILKMLWISFLAFFTSAPIVVNNYFQVNFLSLFLNILFVPIVSFVLFPLSLITILLPFLDEVLLYIIYFFEHLSLFLEKITFLCFNMRYMSLIEIIIYYSIFFLLLYKFSLKKITLFIVIITLFFFAHYNYQAFNNNYSITMLDVGQGDTILLSYPHNKGNILIDTGGIVSNKSDDVLSLADTITIPYLNSEGIHQINTLIISHGDFDHMGEAINLVENFKVEKVIFNCGEFNDLETDLIKVLDKKKIPYYSCIKELNIDNNKLYFLQTKDYDNENDNSNVIYTEIDGYKFMFMGDAGVDKEKNILEEYNISNVDVLKVGHHGSKTSSSKIFIDGMNPKYSIISVGKNNRYGHPNKEVLNVLEDSKVYRTDQDGSIMFKIKNNKLKIETCEP